MVFGIVFFDFEGYGMVMGLVLEISLVIIHEGYSCESGVGLDIG